MEKDSRNVEALKVIVYGKIRRGKCKEAEKFVKRLIDEEPNEVEWRLLLALCYETMGYLSRLKDCIWKFWRIGLFLLELFMVWLW